MNVKYAVFVYGSLKRGYALHDLLDGQIFLGCASSEPLYRLFDCGRYPGLVKATDGGSIQGELYQVDEKCLQKLHEAEGVDEGLYSFENISLQTPFNSLACYAYFYLRPTEHLADCGQEWP